MTFSIDFHEAKKAPAKSIEKINFLAFFWESKSIENPKAKSIFSIDFKNQ